MVAPVKIASLAMGDVDDVAIYAGFAIAEWQKSDVAQRLKKLNIEPHMWKYGPTMYHYGMTVDLWCENYEPEDMAVAKLSGLLDDSGFSVKI